MRDTLSYKSFYFYENDGFLKNKCKLDYGQFLKIERDVSLGY